MLINPEALAQSEYGSEGRTPALFIPRVDQRQEAVAAGFCGQYFCVLSDENADRGDQNAFCCVACASVYRQASRHLPADSAPYFMYEVFISDLSDQIRTPQMQRR